MTDAEEITLEETSTGGRYVIKLSDGAEAYMTFQNLNTDTIIVDHTFVPNQFRGRNLALKLVKRGISDARANGIKIVPQCSYVATQFRRHPDWSDLLAE